MAVGLQRDLGSVLSGLERWRTEGRPAASFVLHRVKYEKDFEEVFRAFGGRHDGNGGAAVGGDVTASEAHDREGGGGGGGGEASQEGNWEIGPSIGPFGGLQRRAAAMAHVSGLPFPPRELTPQDGYARTAHAEEHSAALLDADAPWPTFHPRDCA